MRQNTKRGFTLIELLIVVAIIGLLASIVLIGLQGTRRAARDARRGADMHTVQLALESYFTKCNSHYPVEGADCQNPSQGNRGRLAWDVLATELVNALVLANESQLPQDPLGYPADNERSYQYIVTNEFEASGPGYPYFVMRAIMEEPDNALVKNDVDGSGFYGYTFLGGGNTSDHCGDASGDPEVEYCIESQQ